MRVVYHKVQRTITLKWMVTTPIPTSVPWNPHYYNHLFVLCDGSGGSCWGAGICFPKLRYRYCIGGQACDSPSLCNSQGYMDSAVVDFLALASAISIVHHAFYSILEGLFV